MEPGAEFDSPDIEFEAPIHKKLSRAGERSIASMRDNRPEDRLATKQRMKTMVDNRGAPSSRASRHLSLSRLDAYVEMNPEFAQAIKFLLQFFPLVHADLQQEFCPLTTPLQSR